MIKLEPFNAADFSQLMAWIDDERLMKEWSGSMFSFPLSDAGLTWYVEGANNLHDPDVFIYKAVDSKTSITVGHIFWAVLVSATGPGALPACWWATRPSAAGAFARAW